LNVVTGDGATSQSLKVAAIQIFGILKFMANSIADSNIQSEASERYRTEKGVTIFDIAVKNAGQLFDMRDPSPFRERDLDDDLAEYILSRVTELPKDAVVTIKFMIAEPLDNDNKDAIATAVRSHFEYQAEMLKTKMRENFKRARSFLAIGLMTLITCLTLSELLASAFTNSTISRIVHEGLTISGWVAMWRPIESLLYDWWPIRDQYQLFSRLGNAKIEVHST
jgi:hypothetical protein